jgi:hypothetical protein
MKKSVKRTKSGSGGGRLGVEGARGVGASGRRGVGASGRRGVGASGRRGLGVRGFGIGLGWGGRLVVDFHGGFRAQFKDAGGHNFVALLKALEDADLVAPGFAELDGALGDGFDGFSLGGLGIPHDVDGIAVGGIEDGGGGYDEGAGFLGEGEFDIHEHPVAEAVVGVGEGGLDGEGAGGVAEARIERGEGAFPGFGAEVGDSDEHGALEDGVGELGLGEAELDTHRVEGVHGDHG